MAHAPHRSTTRATNPIRRTFSSRSVREKPRPRDRCVRTSSPSRSSTCNAVLLISSRTIRDSVLFPEPERPVNQRTKPLGIWRYLLDGAPGRHRHLHHFAGGVRPLLPTPDLL